MHPYRAPCPSPARPGLEADDGSRLAFRVMTFTGAVQLASELRGPAPLHAGGAVLGAACVVGGVAWLLRRRSPPA